VPGWSFHGGTGGVLEGQQLVLQNAALNDYAFKLESSFTTLTHNRQYIPRDAVQLRFAYEVLQAGAGDMLQAVFQPMDGSPSTVLGRCPWRARHRPSLTAEFNLPAAILGQVGMIEFRIVDGGGAITAAVLLTTCCCRGMWAARRRP
jgi:hypothetical protein